MAWLFGDGFDLYTLPADALTGYWDSGTAAFTLATGRFAGSRGVAGSINNAVNALLQKSSGANDAVHHLVISIQQTVAITGTNSYFWFTFSDGATAQCTVVFRSDGAILLNSGVSNGTTLATYTGALTTINTWYAFEIEVVINNTTGSISVRKNGNPSNDFSLGSLNTRGGTANNYANRLGFNDAIAGSHQVIDDLFWRSDASSVAWMGDIRCYTRMPASDASVQFSRTPTGTITHTPVAATTFGSISANAGRYTQFTAPYDGTIATATVTLTTGYTGNMKCSLFASTTPLATGGDPGAVLGSATSITNPVTGISTFTFSVPVFVTRGLVYFIGFNSDTASGQWTVAGTPNGRQSTTTSYASFPVASPSSASAAAIVCTLSITISSNSTVVAEPQQDGLTSYVYDSTPGHVDLYNIASIASTPATVVAVTTRAYAQKSDAGTRTAAVQLKSGSTTVASPTVTLTTSGWQWAWRTDTVDPNTSAAWTAAAVDAAQVGPTVIA